MNNFFTVLLEDGTSHHFRSELNAYKFLWETYLHNCPNEPEDMEIEAKEQLDTKTNECNSIVSNSDGQFEKKSKFLIGLNNLRNTLSSLELEDARIKSKDYTVYYDFVKPMSYQIFYIIGASIAKLALLGAFIIYLVKVEKKY